MIPRHKLGWFVNAGAICAGVSIGTLPSALMAAAATPWACDATALMAADAAFEARPASTSSSVDTFELIEERGGEVRYSQSDGQWRPVSFPGTRLGLRFVNATGGESVRLQLQPASGTAAVPLVRSTGCRWTNAVVATWFRNAQDLADGVDPSSPLGAVDIVPFDALLASATHPFQLASATHLRANARYRAGDFPGSVADFGEASRLWLAIDDRARAGAAMLGKADLLRLMGRHPESRQAAIEAIPLLDGPTTRYMRSRAKEAVCHAHHNAGELDLAAACLADVYKELVAQGETDERFNVLTLMMAVQRDQGARLDVEQLDPDVERLLQSTDVDPMRKGRMHLQIAMGLRDQGDVAASLRGFGAALGQFQLATEERERWQANALLQVSDLYADLGMFAQAYRVHTDALAVFKPASAPARVAAALSRLSVIDRKAGNAAGAAKWAQHAASISRRLNLPQDIAIAELLRMEADLDLGIVAKGASERVAAIRADLPAQHRDRAQLVSLRLQARTDRHAAASGLAKLVAPTRPLAVQQEAVLLQARLDREGGREGDARNALEALIARTRTLAAETGNAALSYLMMRSVASARSELATMVATAPGESALSTAWSRLLASQPLGMYRARPVSGGSDISFSAEIARKLVRGEGEWSRSAEVLLLERLRGGAGDAAKDALPALTDVQSLLGPDDVFLMIVPGEPASLMWIVDAKQDRRVALAGRTELRRKTANLLAQIGSTRQAPALDQALTEVSGMMLGAFAGRLAPRRLWVLFDESIGDMPWSALVWPGRDAPLVNTTAISWISGVAFEPAQMSKAGVQPSLEVVIANPELTIASSAIPLPALPGTEREGSMIAVAIPSLQATVHSGSAATPDQLRASLRRRDAIVHLAAHGFSRPGMLGYAGVWLAAKKGESQPQFLSWLDVADTELSAGLAVLNSCQLAAGPDTSSASSMSFASAVSAAGVDQVVAASWPVSDTATLRWVPAFYGALDTRDLGSSAEALRQAQLALRNSRHFRHPFYWASLVHFRHLEVPEVKRAEVR